MSIRTPLAILFAIVSTTVVLGQNTAAQEQQGEGESSSSPPGVVAEEGLFITARRCSTCHGRLQDDAGNRVPFVSPWTASMMANAARDPYWIASVRAETLVNPQLRETIEHKCATCHMPMAHTLAVAGDSTAAVLDDGYLNPDHPLNDLAMDGVSCVVCHQIEATNFGQESSFSGGFSIDTTRPSGERPLFAPHESSAEDIRRMVNLSGFVAEQSDHISQSELCATCHTLYTPFVDLASGEIGGTFPEQTVYLEWLASERPADQTCNTCHMPAAEGTFRVSRMSDARRTDVSMHHFAGGNSYMLTMLQQFATELALDASAQQFQVSIDQALALLQNETAHLGIENGRLADGVLAFEVAVDNRAGHKFPSGYPSRRAWLHVTVTDSEETVHFESGAPLPSGAITDNDNDIDPAAYEPHYATIRSADQVQIYETILTNSLGEVTTTLLHAAEYAKDNRFLPVGYDSATAHSDIAVAGAAAGDPDFVGGSDRTRYELTVGEVSGPLTVTVELLFQSIGHRWAENLRVFDSEETNRFSRYYDAVPNVPVVIQSATATIPP